MSSLGTWADAMQALTLFAVDPAGLGGIALRAGPGPVRGRFLQLVPHRLPPGTPVRRVPLNAGDDRLLGGLDLAATLHAGRPILQRGLLAEADGGIVLLSMAERIEPGMAARLQAAQDEGAVMLQRDGFAQCAPTRFGLIALDEGLEPDERPPASLLDRLAFHIDLYDVSWRDVAEHDEFEQYHAWSGEKMADRDAIEAFCAAALALGIASLRAPLLALRTARAAARCCGRDHLVGSDVSCAARLVLAPRATCLPAEPPAHEDMEPPDERDNDSGEPAQRPEEPLSDVVLAAVKATLPPDLLMRLSREGGSANSARLPGRAGPVRTAAVRGRPIGTERGDPRNGARLHVLETLKVALPWQMMRHRHDRIEIRRDDFRIIRFRQRTTTTTLFSVDASGSATLHRLAEAKGAIELLLGDCYVRRDQVGLIAFRGQEATVLLPPTGSLVRARRSLAGMAGGGATPLAAGIEATARLADGVRRSGRAPVMVFLTDGRANVARDGSTGRAAAEADALEAARFAGALGIAALLIDTSPRPNPFAGRLAEAMQARYVPLPYVEAGALSHAVRAAAAA